GCVELGPGGAVCEIGRPGRSRRAVHVAELRAGERDRVVGVPAAPAEERRRETALADPRALAAYALPRRTSARPCVRRAREMRVLAECAARPHRARTGEPHLLTDLARPAHLRQAL